MNWLLDNWLISAGLIILAVTALISILFKTPWGHWHKGRGRRYGRLKDWDERYKHYK